MSLPRPQKVIRKRFDVEEEDKTMTFRHGDTSPIGGSSGNLFFLGVEGSGRRELARAAASRLGIAYAEAATRGDLEKLMASAGRAVAVTDPALAESRDLVQAMRDSGKVFVLMSLPHVLAARLGDPSRAEVLAADVARYEPAFMGAAHFVLTVDATFQEMAEDVAEKALL